MKTRILAISLVAFALAAFASCSLAGAAMVGIYRNTLESTAQRGELLKLAGRSCTRRGSEEGLQITLGERTSSCDYRTPVLGRSLQIVATERLLSGTPLAVQHKAFLGVELRAGGGAKYQLLVFPLQKKAQLVRITPEGTKYLSIEKKVPTILGVNKPNSLTLQALNVASGPEKGQTQLLAYVGGTLVGEFNDTAAGELSGSFAAVTIGATKNGNGLIGTVDDVVIRVPSPF